MSDRALEEYAEDEEKTQKNKPYWIGEDRDESTEPTNNNLYKFIALSGVALSIWGTAFWFTMKRRRNEQ